MTEKKLKQKSFDFESALSQLTTLVETMEKGGLSLEASLQSFEQGIHLIRDCQQALSTAEQKVKILTQNQGEQNLEPFSVDED